MATITTSGAVVHKAGANVSTSVTDDLYNEWIEQAESYLNNLTRYNWIDNYATLNEDVKKTAEEFVACLAAIEAIKYDMSGYTSRVEAEDMINILAWRVHRMEEKLMKDQNFIDYVKGA